MSLKEALADTFKKQTATIVVTPTIGGVLAYIAAWRNMFGLNTFHAILVGIGCLFIVFFITFVYYIIKYNKKNPQSEYEFLHTISQLNIVYSAIGWSKNNIQADYDVYMEAMEVVCDSMKNIFDLQTKSNCSISVKIPINSENLSAQSQVINICRDSESVDARTTNKYLSTVHRIFANTCFNTILVNLSQPNQEQKEHFYINNNIATTPDYLNSSTVVYKNGILPYKSEAVVPIMPLHENDSDQRDSNKDSDTIYDILGFLCVDSDAINSFDENKSISIMKGIADGLYGILIKRGEFLKLNTEPTVDSKSLDHNDNKRQFKLKDRRKGSQHESRNRRNK